MCQTAWDHQPCCRCVHVGSFSCFLRRSWGAYHATHAYKGTRCGKHAVLDHSNKGVQLFAAVKMLSIRTANAVSWWSVLLRKKNARDISYSEFGIRHPSLHASHPMRGGGFSSVVLEAGTSCILSACCAGEVTPEDCSGTVFVFFRSRYERRSIFVGDRL